MRARAVRRCLLPYAGMTQIRFKGYFSAPKQLGTPSYGMDLSIHRTQLIQVFIKTTQHDARLASAFHISYRNRILLASKSTFMYPVRWPILY